MEAGMSDTARWGILGVASIAIEQMAPALHLARGGRLCAVATSSHRDKAAPLVGRVPGLTVYEGYDALLADPEIDAVYVPLPNHMHVDWSERAARAGKHVLCEKPLALDLAGIDRLIAAREAAGVLIAEALMIAHHPQWHRARELIEAGALGSLHRIDATFTAPLFDPGDFRNQPDGGGALRDLGPYALGAARLLTGEEPEALLGVTLDRENGVDATAQVTARFPSFLYTGHVSMRAALSQHVSVHGTEATLRLPVPFNPPDLGEGRVEVRGDETSETWHYPALNQYVAQVEAFNAAVTGQAAFPFPLEAGRGTQAMVDAIYRDAGGPA
jgi:predicted dehydrogenase